MSKIVLIVLLGIMSCVEQMRITDEAVQAHEELDVVATTTVDEDPVDDDEDPEGDEDEYPEDDEGEDLEGDEGEDPEGDEDEDPDGDEDDALVEKQFFWGRRRRSEKLPWWKTLPRLPPRPVRITPSTPRPTPKADIWFGPSKTRCNKKVQYVSVGNWGVRYNFRGTDHISIQTPAFGLLKLTSRVRSTTPPYGYLRTGGGDKWNFRTGADGRLNDLNQYIRNPTNCGKTAIYGCCDLYGYSCRPPLAEIFRWRQYQVDFYVENVCE